MAVGPGSVAQSTDNPLPLLWNATDQDVVQVFNPLPEDFAALVAIDKPVNAPFEVRKTVGAEAATSDEGAVRTQYGINLKNPEFPAKQHIGTQVIIKAGETKSLLGGVAKVAVNQLVSEIMQREGNSLKMADPHARIEVERRVVQGHGNIQSYLPDTFQTEREQVHNAIENLNQGEQNDQADTQGTGTADETDSRVETPEAAGVKRGPGRSKQG